MKQYILSILLSALTGIGNMAMSQDTLGMGANGTIFDISSSTTYGSSDSVHVFIKNYGSTAFSGTVNIYTAADSGSSWITFLNDTLAVTGLNPGDSIQKDIIIPYTPGNFRIGTNIVVIWPSATGATIVDSAMATVIITGYSSVIEVGHTGELIIYPNPTNDFLHLRTQNNLISSSSTVKQMKLYDIKGKLVGEYNNGTSFISMHQYPAGNYMLVVEMNNNSTKNYKVIRK